MDKKFFNNESVADYYRGITKSIKEDIDKMTDTEILSYDKENLIEYFTERYTPDYIKLYDLDSPIIDMEQKTITEPKTTIYVFEGRRTFETQTDYIIWKLTIRYSGDSYLFHVQPSQFTESLSGKEYANINVNKVNNEGVGTINVYIKKELANVNQIKDINNVIINDFNKEISIFIKNIDYLNKDLKNSFSSVITFIKTTLNDRLQKIKNTREIFEKFNIPLKESGKSTFSQPIVLHKKQIELPTKHEILKENEYSIDKNEVKKINELIYACCSTMERMPKTYISNGEEDLRNIILTALNTQYTNATGETFSNKGKTDIFIGQCNKAAYIAECKLWSGDKILQDAVKQLLGYTTWKECSGTLLIFNKANKDFNRLLTKIPDLIKSLDGFVKLNTINANIFDFEIKKDADFISSFPIHLMIFNLYFDDKNKS